MFVISLQRGKEKLMFRMSDGFDDEAIISGKVEEGPRFSWGAEFRKDIFGGERKKVICWV